MKCPELTYFVTLPNKTCTQHKNMILHTSDNRMEEIRNHAGWALAAVESRSVERTRWIWAPSLLNVWRITEVLLYRTWLGEHD